MRHLIRTIVLSRTYQLSAIPNDFNREDTRYFSRTRPRSMTPMQLLDAVCQATEVPEKFEGLPPGSRSIHLPDGEAPSGLPFLNIPVERRAVCECERETEEVPVTTVMSALNSDMIQKKLTQKDNRIGRLLAKKASDDEIMDELFLATLSRLPKETDRKTAVDFIGRAQDKRRAWEDVLWALFNSKEFIFRP